jgi:hypothetical protein
MSKRNYWILFAATQVCGIVIPYFGNVHINIMPMLIGMALLLPGILLDMIPSIDHLPTAVMLLLAVLANSIAWFLLRKVLRLDASTGHPSDDVIS